MPFGQCMKASKGETGWRHAQVQFLMCSFVVKALDASGHKVFLNICESELVLSPPAWQQSEVRLGLI